MAAHRANGSEPPERAARPVPFCFQRLLGLRPEKPETQLLVLGGAWVPGGDGPGAVVSAGALPEQVLVTGPNNVVLQRHVTTFLPSQIDFDVKSIGAICFVGRLLLNLFSVERRFAALNGSNPWSFRKFHARFSGVGPLGFFKINIINRPARQEPGALQ